MPQQQDPNGDIRAAFTMRQLDRAQQRVSSGATGLILRVTLAVLFMFLITYSYHTYDIAGPVFISVLFVVAFFLPAFYQAATAYLARRREQSEGTARGIESKA